MTSADVRSRLDLAGAAGSVVYPLVYTGEVGADRRLGAAAKSAVAAGESSSGAYHVVAEVLTVRMTNCVLQCVLTLSLGQAAAAATAGGVPKLPVLVLLPVARGWLAGCLPRYCCASRVSL